MNIIYDIEVFPNCFTLSAEHADYPLTWQFEISPWRDDSQAIIEWCYWLRDQRARMVGFNNVGFDYPIAHTLLRMGRGDPRVLYDKAIAIISSQDTNRWQHMVYPSDRLVEQLDLYLIHHFDNKARKTGLKALEFNMRLDNVSDLPFPVGTVLNQEQISTLLTYNAHDVRATKRFLHESHDMIRFREELTAKYPGKEWINFNDTKIGKQYFEMELEKAGVQCYTYGPDGRAPRQTKRPQIMLNDAILPWIKFESPEFQRVIDWLRQQVITETKGVFKDLTARVNGFEFVFGTGGIHGSIENETVRSDDEYVVIDLDVSSYYPNLAIKNKFYPEHLSPIFCAIYEGLYEQRKQFKKGSAENAMLKLALNGCYGDSNNPFSVFYDPLFTMKITLNGQLLLCLLAEQLMRLGKICQINTDGLTLRVSRSLLPQVEVVRRWWEQITQLTLEEVEYRVMAIRDVNNYIAQDVSGKIKRKGAYEYDMEWHQDHGAMVIAKVAEQVLIHGAPIRETVTNWPDKHDFMLRIKVPKGSTLLLDEVPQQATTRYYVAQGGGTLIKLMPPLAKKPNEWRRIGVQSGWKVCVCNDIEAAVLPIDYEWYVQEIEKLVLPLM